MIGTDVRADMDHDGTPLTNVRLAPRASSHTSQGSQKPLTPRWASRPRERAARGMRGFWRGRTALPTEGRPLRLSLGHWRRPCRPGR